MAWAQGRDIGILDDDSDHARKVGGGILPQRDQLMWLPSHFESKWIQLKCSNPPFERPP